MSGSRSKLLTARLLAQLPEKRKSLPFSKGVGEGGGFTAAPSFPPQGEAMYSDCIFCSIKKKKNKKNNQEIKANN